MTLSPLSDVHRYGFVLLPNAALMSFAAATEPLRAANLIAGRPLYESLPLALDGGEVRFSSGLAAACGDLADEGPSCHSLFVVAGGNPADWAGAEALHPHLRRLARQGVRIGGISSGAYVLAAAGLLDGRDFTIHWEHAPAFREAFGHLSPHQARYVIDGDRITCGGGVAPLDMMHALIAARMGTDFARRVSDWYLHAMVAEPGGPQRSAGAERFGTHHPALVSVLETMERTLENPLDRAAMARLAGVSPRHLDRLFAGELGRSFADCYRALRLDHARKLLEQSVMAIAEVAFATGFSSASHFCRAYKEHFGMTPKSARSDKGRGTGP